jgi:hypothetical protein
MKGREPIVGNLGPGAGRGKFGTRAEIYRLIHWHGTRPRAGGGRIIGSTPSMSDIISPPAPKTCEAQSQSDGHGLSGIAKAAGSSDRRQSQPRVTKLATLAVPMI